MAAPLDAKGLSDYRAWQRDSIRVDGRVYAVATKPGLFAHAQRDPAAALLAELVSLSTGDTVVVSGPGGGLLGAVAVHAGAARVVLTDRHIVATEAARRTIALNAIGVDVQIAHQHGARDLVADGAADVVAIRIPAEKLPLQFLLREALRVLKVGGRCYIAGASTEGVKPAERMLAALFGTARVMTSGGGYRVVVATKSDDRSPAEAEAEAAFLDPDHFRQLRPTWRGQPLHLFTRPGVFSWEHVDEATELLAEALTVDDGARVLDLGCGCGALGAVASTLASASPITLVDADSEAVRCAARTVAANGMAGARVRASDVADAVREEQFDLVVSNPPFHVGKHTALDVPMAFIQQAHEVLTVGGRLLLVANRTLPYESAITQRFGRLHTVHDGARFKVLLATKAS